jgi:hypothetical protein
MSFEQDITEIKKLVGESAKVNEKVLTEGIAR